MSRTLPPPRFQLVVLLVAAVLAARYITMYYDVMTVLHIGHVCDHLKQFTEGKIWFEGPPLAETGLAQGGATYYWISSFARLLGSPVPGIVRGYFILELVGIGCWIWFGSRARIPAPLLVTGGLLLGVFWETKYLMFENMTVAVHLSVALFGASLAAIHSKRWVWMFPIALLAGVALMVHAAAWCLVAPIAVATLVAPGPRVRRLLAFSGGMLCCLMLSFGAVDSGSGDKVADVARVFASVSAREKLVGLLEIGHHYPLAVAGFVVALGRLLWRGIRRATREPAEVGSAGPMVGDVLAISWFAVVGVSLTWALAITADVGAGDYRYGLLVPARAYLGGLAIAWSLDVAHRLLEGAMAVRLRRTLVPAVAGALVLAALVVQIKPWKEHAQREFAETSAQSCTTDLLQKTRFTARYMARHHRAVGAAGFQSDHEVLGVDSLTLDDYFFWQRTRWPWRWARWPTDEPLSPVPPPTQRWVVVPRSGGLDPAADSGAKLLGDFAAIPVDEPLELKAGLHDEDGTTSYTILGARAHDRAGPCRLLASFTEPGWTYVPDTPLLSIGGRTTTPVAGCECRDFEHGGSEYRAWLMYDVADCGTDSAPLKLVVRHEGRLGKPSVSRCTDAPIEGE